MARTLGLPANRNAFLDMIGASEGTTNIPTGDDGYRVLVGSTMHHPIIFPSYADHPRVLNRKLNSTAAGRYQIIAGTFDLYRGVLGLHDFAPEAQDAVALRLLLAHGALPFIDSGDLPAALLRCSKVWASFPESHDNQHTQTLGFLQAEYLCAGGKLKAN